MIQRLVWLTDLHLDFVTPGQSADLAGAVLDLAPDAVLIGGDTGEAPTFAGHLVQLARIVAAPVYFVLGNHDYYRGSIAAVREQARALSHSKLGVTWLPDAGVIRLTNDTSLVGHGGWGDGRAGNFLESRVRLNDFRFIDDLRAWRDNSDRTPDAGLREFVPYEQQLLDKLHSLGDEAAAHFRTVLPQALEQSRHVVVLTHVPPFREACWHAGHVSNDQWAPHFTCVAVGVVLREFMERHPDCRMTVLCGHTHSPGRVQILDNLVVLTGGAEYGKPVVQETLNIE